jgi:hypothetical protein
MAVLMLPGMVLLLMGVLLLVYLVPGVVLLLLLLGRLGQLRHFTCQRHRSHISCSWEILSASR